MSTNIFLDFWSNFSEEKSVTGLVHTIPPMKVTNVSMKLREIFHNIQKGPFSKYSEISLRALVTTPPCSSVPCLLCVFTFVFWNSKSSGSVSPGLYFTNQNRLILLQSFVLHCHSEKWTWTGRRLQVICNRFCLLSILMHWVKYEDG